MYYTSNMYQSPYYTNVNTPMNNQDYMQRNHQDNNLQLDEVILAGINKEASAIDLYSRLANVAPNEKHRNEILYSLEAKKNQINQFANLYMSLTGREPLYRMDTIPFHSYEEGLQKAYQAGIDSYEEYRNSGLLASYSQVQNVFYYASNGEIENLNRLEVLNQEVLKDYGPNPFVVDIEEVSKENNTFRTALWTGKHLQLTLMSIGVGEDIGLEQHSNLDQFIRIEEGEGLVQMGDSKNNLDFREKVYDDFAIFVPAGKWHNLTNTGNKPIKLYTIYAPPQHPFGTVHETKAIAMAAEENHHH